MACKVLKMQGFTFKMEEADLLCTFLEAPGCLLQVLALQEAELEYDVMERLSNTLKNCRCLTTLNFSKNNLGIDDCIDSESSLSSAKSIRSISVRQRNRKLCVESEMCMINLVTGIIRQQT